MASDNLQQVLEGYEQEHIQLDVKFLNQALVAATLNDNYECIGKPIKLGARNIDECIQLGKKEEVTNAMVMLLLMRAALTGDDSFLKRLLNPSLSVSTLDKLSNNSEFSLPHQAVKIVSDGRLSTIDALEVAQKSGQHSVHRKLMMLTRINMDAGSVDWSKLNLLDMDTKLFKACNWLVDLDLSANKLNSIPSEIGMLNKMINANLSNNDLTTIPASLLQLPELKKLNLSHNKINHLPDVPQWSASLSAVDLSDNCLSWLSMNYGASALVSLNISKNCFNSVPLCICTFTMLTSLDLSNNPRIRSLPCELGALTKLEELNLSGLKKLKEPPKPFTDSPQKCISYLRNRLSNYYDSSHCIQLMIVGNPGSGKHTLISQLQNRKLSSHERNIRIYVSECQCRPNITKRAVWFRIWMFKCLEDYQSFTHNCFLLQRSLYLVLFNLNRENKGVHNVKAWLESITHKAPYSSVMVIGTHVDEIISRQDISNGDFLLQQAKMVASVYENILEAIGFLQIGLQHHQDAVSQLEDNIHSHAVNYSLRQLEFKRALIQEIGIGGERVEELLNCSKGTLDVQFLNQALEFATRMDSAVNVGKVALVHPDLGNINQCIKLAEREGKHHAHAMLLLITAIRSSSSGNKKISDFLLLEPCHPACKSESSSYVYCRRFSVNIPINVPIKIAQQFNKIQVMNELLLKTGVCQIEGYVHWGGLQLHEMYLSLLRKICWVKTIVLSRNKLTTLPQEIDEYLKQVVKIDLQCNDLTTIPGCLFELPNLAELYLAHNKLQELPEVTKWSPSLIFLDLSNNHLSSLPSKVIAPSICSLNISRNEFHTVPLCICTFTTLHSLDLSNNSNIVALPAQMGRLDSLTNLNLSGLKNLKDPPKALQNDCRECIRYLNSKLCNAKGCYHMKLMVLGNTNQGKTTLVARLQGKEHLPIHNHMSIDSGLDISCWWYRPSIGRRAFHFSIWDFSGETGNPAICRCFLTQCTLYLLVFNLEHGEEGIKELTPWLNTIAIQAPHSRVIVVGTHLDAISHEERREIDALLHRIGTLAANYKKTLQIVEVLPVGLENHIENIGLLKEAIYNHAASYSNQRGQLIMGRKIPASYHALANRLETLQLSVGQGIVKPIMHIEEFKAMIHQMSLDDLHNHDEELRRATLFLTDIGALLHFDDRGHDLHELYFIHPCWLCNLFRMMHRTVTTSPFITNGILYARDIPMVFMYAQKHFPWQYLEQFIALLDKFEIALLLDNRRFLVPSMLPNEKPQELKVKKFDILQEPVYSRIIMLNSTSTLIGFWSRLLSRVMHSVSRVSYVLDEFTDPASTPQHLNNEAYRSSSMHPLRVVEINRAFELSLSKSSVTLSSLISPMVKITPESAAIYAALAHTDSLPFISAQSAALDLLPDVSKQNISNPLLEYWNTGLYYKDEEVTFRIESLQSSKQFKSDTEEEGLIVIASANDCGKKIFGQLIDLVVSLVDEWYRDAFKLGSSGLQQKVPCFECITQGRAKPFQFEIEECLSMISKNETTLKCGYCCDKPAKNHIASLDDIVPDILLQYIDPQFLLNAEGIEYQDDSGSLLGEFDTVFSGKYEGKSVAIKKYYNIIDLWREAKILHQLCHPCIVNFIGVCAQPLCVLVLEQAPLTSLEFPLLRKKIPIHRLTIFRIATEVASGLRYMHSLGIIKRDIKASNVLLWTLDLDSLCHCKLCDFSISAHLSPIGIRGLQGARRFIAPEVLYTSKRKQCSVYDHRADIFSFGMLLYQMIARRNPYHDILDHRIENAVLSGQRPKLQDIHESHTSFHYLTQIMKMCWEDNPKNRPDTTTIIDKICHSATQTVMCVKPINAELLTSKAIAITPSDFAKAGHPNRHHSELWVCCDRGKLGTEVCMFDVQTMLETSRTIIKGDQIQCMALYGDHVWLGSRPVLTNERDPRPGFINVLDIECRELTHSCDVREGHSVTCITATGSAIYIGTLEGYCLFYGNINEIRANVKPGSKRISEHPIDGIVYIQQHLWVAHARCISFLNSDDLTIEYCIHRETSQKANIGQLSFSSDPNVIWSAHLGGVILSAWDACNTRHMYDIDSGRHLKRIADALNDADNVMTAMTPALDTVWIGMATGHIMIFHKEELLSYFHPYEGHVQFLTCIPSSGPCGMEKAMVASGGKQFRPLVEGFDKGNDKTSSTSESSTLIIWEAYEARTIRQIKLIEQNAPDHLSNHTTVCRMIQEGRFRDGTHIMTPDSEESIASEAKPFEPSFNDDLNTPSPIKPSSKVDKNSSPEDESNPPLSQVPSATGKLKKETFSISLPDSKQTILIQCTKPVVLESLYNKVQTTVVQDDCCLVYYRDEEAYELQTQENLEEYLKLPDKPQLCIVKTEIISPQIHHATDKSSEEEISISVMGPIEQNLKFMCPKPPQLDALMNVISSVESLKDQNFNLMYLSSNLEIKVNSQNDFDRYLAISNRPSLLASRVEQNASSSATEETKLAYAVSSSSNTQSNVALGSSDDVTLHFKLFDSEHTLDMVCTKPFRLEAVLNDLKLIANLGDQDWQLVYPVDESYVKIKMQEDFDKYLSVNNSASMPTVLIHVVSADDSSQKM